MSTDRDVTRIVRSWLHEDAYEDADRILNLVLEEIDTTPQRRAGWLARRFPIMNSNIFRVGIAAAVVIVLAFVGLRFLPGLGNTGGPPDPTATPIPTIEPTATAMPQLNGQEPLPPGRYQVDPALPMEVIVQVPEGWSAGGNWVVVGSKGNEAPDGMAIRFYTADSLYENPLAPNLGILPTVGATVDDLVNAMLEHADWPTTGADAVTIDGYSGQVVHLTLPATVNDATAFYLFVDSAGGQIWGWEPGQLFDIYVIDVGGDRLVIDAFHFPGTTEEDVAAQRALIDALQLAP